MKKFAIVLAVVVASAGSSFAQTVATEDPRGQAYFEFLLARR